MKDIKETTKAIKNALSEKYGRENISVRKDTGTASGWILVKVLIDSTDVLNFREIENDIKRIIKETNVELYSYSDDMGYDHDCLLINIERK